MSSVAVGFATRLENIVKITNAFVEGGKDGDEARQEAKFMEGEILKNAKSDDEYAQLCNELVQTMNRPTDEVLTLHEPSESDEILNVEGPTFGNYVSATFHQDGQMSTVYKAKAASASSLVSIVALKVTSPSQMQAPHNSEREARILAEARHEHVVPLLESFWHQGDRFVLVFPFLRQDLENLLRTGSLTKKQSHLVVGGLLDALSHIHRLGIIHRDIKPSNILLKTMDGPVFLADFGIAWSTVDPASESPTSKITDVGTTRYRPPELLFGDKSYDTSLDIWAAGCVISEMVRSNHYPLFDAGPLGSELGLIKSIFTTLGTPNEQTWPSVQKLPDWGKMRFQDFEPRPWQDLLPGAPVEAVDFVRRTVRYESTERLTAAEAREHPFVMQSLKTPHV